jgi:hypothetical protein
MGGLTRVEGPVARLRDIVNRTPKQFEQLFGYQAGQLSQGYQLLVLKERLAPRDLDLSPHIRNPLMASAEPRPLVTRPHRNGAYIIDFNAYALDRLARGLLAGVALHGPDRLVKIVPLLDWASARPRRCDNGGKRGPVLLDLARPKRFMVAADVDADHRFCGRGLELELGAYTRYDQRSSILQYLAAA